MSRPKYRGVSLFAAVLVSSLAFVAATSSAGNGNNNRDGGGGKGRKPVATAVIDNNEIEHLVFMREEEKLARDVYITLGKLYPELKVFGKIDDSEQRHSCAVCDLLERFGVPDPSTNDNVGIYTGEHYGAYFTSTYAELVERGSVSAMEALYVGAFIEELDMLDIRYCPQEIIEAVEGIEEAADCGRVYTDNPRIDRLYGSLLEGSENHLRAFVRNIERFQGQGSYQAQVLPQEQVDEILERSLPDIEY